MEKKRPRYYINEIRAALDYKLRTDDKVILLGEDICDPFGGCFKVTQGLSTKYPRRVINTPISEAALIGCAIGLAMQGYKPVVEIMFCDFLTLCADQIINHACMFNKHIQPINITIRTTIGKPDYGFQHTKDLSGIFEPYMRVFTPTPSHNVRGLLALAIDCPEPVLFVEDSKYYMEKLCEIK